MTTTNQLPEEKHIQLHESYEGLAKQLDVVQNALSDMAADDKIGTPEYKELRAKEDALTSQVRAAGDATCKEYHLAMFGVYHTHEGMLVRKGGVDTFYPT